MSEAFQQLAWGIVHAYNLDKLSKADRERVFQWIITGHRTGDPRRACPVCNMMTIAHPAQEGI